MLCILDQALPHVPARFPKAPKLKGLDFVAARSNTSLPGQKVRVSWECETKTTAHGRYSPSFGNRVCQKTVRQVYLQTRKEDSANRDIVVRGRRTDSEEDGLLLSAGSSEKYDTLLLGQPFPSTTVIYPSAQALSRRATVSSAASARSDHNASFQDDSTLQNPPCSS